MKSFCRFHPDFAHITCVRIILARMQSYGPISLQEHWENIGQLHASTTICTGRMRNRAVSPISGLDYGIDGDAIR